MRSSFKLVIDSDASVPDSDRTTAIHAVGDQFRGTFYALGCPCELLIADVTAEESERLLSVVAEEAWRIEAKFSRYLDGNIVDRINSGKETLVDDETADLLDFAATLHETTSGRFDITSGVLRKVWTFDGGTYAPSDRDVQSTLPAVGWHRVTWDRPVIRLRRGMQIDFGGIGKEYAVDRAASLIDHFGAAFLINFGGDIFANRAPRDSSGWRVGIDALAEAATSGSKTLFLKNGGVATSGDTRRFVTFNGIRYGHILDPRTGWPVAGAPQSVTVAADSCTQAGMLATLSILQGEAAETFLEQQNVRFWSFR